MCDKPSIDRCRSRRCKQDIGRTLISRSGIILTPATIVSVRYHYMNAQGCVDRDCERILTENDILSPRQQIRLHFRCLVREHQIRASLGGTSRGFAGRFSSPILLTEKSICKHSVEQHPSGLPHSISKERMRRATLRGEENLTKQYRLRRLALT